MYCVDFADSAFFAMHFWYHLLIDLILRINRTLSVLRYMVSLNVRACVVG